MQPRWSSYSYNQKKFWTLHAISVLSVSAPCGRFVYHGQVEFLFVSEIDNKLISHIFYVASVFSVVTFPGSGASNLVANPFKFAWYSTHGPPYQVSVGQEFVHRLFVNAVNYHVVTLKLKE